MASQLTDDLIQSGRLVKRRYFQIPKDQQAQLENAWSETLSHGPNPMFNLPASVLEDVKDLHMRIYAESTRQPASSAQQPSAANSTELPPRIGTRDQPNSSPQQDDDEELPWSSSPEHHLRARSELRLPSPIPLQHSSPLKSTLKRNFPPQYINSERQSSSVISEGLEFDPPGHAAEVLERPVNRTSLRVIATGSGKLEPTPPSAQMPIGTGEHDIYQPTAKRRRMMEDTCISGDDQEPAEPVAASKLSQKPDSNQNSLTTITSASSPSLSTRHARKKGAQPAESKVMSDPNPFPSWTPTFEGRQRETAAGAQHLLIAGTPMPEPSFIPPPAQRNIAVKASSHSQIRTQQPPQLPQVSPTSSFETFKLTYPDYSRGSRDFVIALLSLKHLKRDRALHEFLYDDFIRAYSSDYFAYVSECSRKQVDKILPGIQWYHQNQEVEDVLYTKGCVRRKNLADFLDAHAKEAHSIRRILEDSQSTESAVEDSDDAMEDAVGGGEGNDGLEHGLEDIELDRDESRASPELHIQSPGPVTRSSQLRDQTLARIDKATEAARIVGDVGQDDVVMNDSDEEDVRQPLPGADNTRRTPQVRVETPSAVMVTATSNGWHGPRARKSPTPAAAQSFASQEIDWRFSRTIPWSSPGRSTRSRTRVARQIQKAPKVSPAFLSQEAVKSSPSNKPRSQLAGDKNSGDEDTFESPMPPPPQLAATSPSSKRSRVISADKDAEDDDALAFEPPVSPPQRAIRRPSTSMPKRLSVDDEHSGDGSGPPEPPPPPPQGDGRSVSTTKHRNVVADEQEDNARQLPVSPLSHTVKPWPNRGSKRFDVDEGGDTDEDDAFDPPPPKKTTQPFPIPESRPISSTATARPAKSSTIPAPNPAALAQSSAMMPEKAVARVSNASSVSLGAGRRPSAGSSIASSANVTRSKKRLSETPEQRSLRLRTFMEAQRDKKRPFSSGQPASTFASKG